jgi:hypothetical protein
MNKFQGFLGAAAASLALASTAAHANSVWDFTITGTGVQASGSFEAAGNGSTASTVLSMTGSYTDPQTTNGTITGVVALNADPDFVYDNQFGGTPYFSSNGLLFDVNGSQDVNLYSKGSGYWIATFEPNNVVLNEAVTLTISAAPVPEPAPLAMMLAGATVLVFARRRKTPQ